MPVEIYSLTIHRMGSTLYWSLQRPINELGLPERAHHLSKCMIYTCSPFRPDRLKTHPIAFCTLQLCAHSKSLHMCMRLMKKKEIRMVMKIDLVFAA